ncbi:hypothetical protein N0V94_008067 [Neodidymelliopsis sp. IMI 364377]|nr:hypothetical protein N0V94_008067 [Neodidymelliopsis sp. IMI 364377]
MTPKHKRTRNADSTTSKSSDTSEASEDNAPESDDDSPSKQRGVAAENDMSDRQTRKINSGSFGMFNAPMLSHRTRRTSKPTKKKRMKEYSAYTPTPRSSCNTRSSLRADSEVFVVDDDNEQSLFIPESVSRQPIIIDDESEDEQSAYEGMSVDRREKVKEYLATSAIVDTVNNEIAAAEDELVTATKERQALTQKLADMDVMTEERIKEILRERDEAIRLANEAAEAQMQRFRKRVPVRKTNYEERLQACKARETEARDRISGSRHELEGVRKRMVELEREGGFELGSDVRKVQA